VGNSSHSTGADTSPRGDGRIEYAEVISRSRAIWLKSTKIRLPRSSFHQFTVTSTGSRRASSRPMAIAACLASMKSAPSIGAKTWTPRPPLVLQNPVRPASASTSRNSCAARTAIAKSDPG
jgi:hypothetical protein